MLHRLRYVGIAAAAVIVTTAGALLALGRGTEPSDDPPSGARAIGVEDELIPPHREPSPSPVPPSPSPSPSPKPRPKPSPKPTVAVNLDVYRGLGAWVDIYDTSLDPSAVVDDLHRRRVKTLYLETNNWRSGGSPPCTYGPDVDILYPDVVARYLDKAHAKGISVVAWYLPGYADIDRDMRRSMAAINFVTASGNRFDGFAPDIEARGEFSCKGVPADQIRDRFNAGIVEYNKRLRAAVPPGTVLGAIVVDAKNNERAPSRWEGFPWPDIARSYDIILPMAYWTASPSNGGCPGAEIDTADYMKQVVTKTQALMGVTKPMHLIGGVADCISPAETGGYASSSKALGAVGISLYDYSTQTSHSQAEALWAELGKFN